MAKKRKPRKAKLVDVINNNQNKHMAVTKVDTVVTYDDGTTASFSSVAGTPPVAPTETEVDVMLSDGTTKKFVPAA